MERCGKVIAAVASEVLIAPAWPEALEDGQDAADFIERYDIAAMAEHFAKAVLWAPQTALLARPLASFERVSPRGGLIDDFAHPTSHTGLWGPTGSGKGVLAAYKIATRTKVRRARADPRLRGACRRMAGRVSRTSERGWTTYTSPSRKG